MSAEAALHTARTEALRARRFETTFIWTARLVLAVGIIAAWELAAGALISIDAVSRPSAILAAWVELLRNGLLEQDLIVTLQEFIIGFVTGTVVGVVTGFVLTVRDVAYRLLEPYFLAIYGIPKIALAPLFILWFGIGLLPKEVLVGVLVFFLVLINTVAGVRSVKPEMVQVVRVFGAKGIAVHRVLIFPHALPIVLTAVRASIPSGMLGAVLGEMLGGGRGLGYLLLQATNYVNMAQTFAILFTLASMVLIFRLVLLPVEGWVARREIAEGVGQ